jgi:predicted dehydrogenase
MQEGDSVRRRPVQSSDHKQGVERRDFLAWTGAAVAGFWMPRSSSARTRSPNEKLNVACIGVGGRGHANTDGMMGENIVAVCEVDSVRGREKLDQLPRAVKFTDWRKLLDRFHKQLDAVVISTPDHHHAPIAMAAMELGKHVYCEKPLTRTVGEARRIARAAAKYRVVTQVGNGGNASSGARRSVELIRAGVINPVREIHAWTDRPSWIWKQGIDRPVDTPPVPATLDWNSWLGGAPKRPYSPVYIPGKWRGWYDFGTGAIGDMGAHICNVAFWGLELRDPKWIEAQTSERHLDTFPAWNRIAWQFPARLDRPAIGMHWYDGGRRPASDLLDGRDVPGNGLLLIGDKGKLFMPDPDGKNATLLPEDRFAGLKRPPKTLPDSPGHHEEWIAACKEGNPHTEYMSHFGRGAIMAECFALGNIAVRVGQRIEWDAANARIKNIPQANEFVDPPYRTSW